MEDYGNEGSYRMDSAYTDSKGDYVTKEKSMDGAIDWVHKEKRLKVILEDVDGGANGGEFATDTIKSENITVEQVLRKRLQGEGRAARHASGRLLASTRQHQAAYRSSSSVCHRNGWRTLDA